MSANVLHLPIPPAPEDQPDWYRVLRELLADQSVPDRYRLAANQATAHHDRVAAELARLGTYLNVATVAAERHQRACPASQQ